MTRKVLLAAVVVGVLAGGTQAAYAKSATGTECDSSTQTCTVTVISPGTPSAPAGSGNGTGSGHGSGGGGGGAEPSPSNPASRQTCTYQAQPGYQQPAPPGSGPGAWYLETCTGFVQFNLTTWTEMMVWLPNGSVPAAAKRPAPAVLAAEAQQRLKLPDPVIESNPAPGHPQLVSLPMWSWVPRSVFTASSATASVPGESVTATATPVTVTWNWGDGTSTTCSGPGTPYTSTGSPTAASPSCGHTYTQDSGSGDFTVSATISWTVTWAGGGQSGAFNDLTTSATEAVHVEQSRALVTGG